MTFLCFIVATIVFIRSDSSVDTVISAFDT